MIPTSPVPDSRLNVSRIAFAVGTIAFGFVNLGFGSFALQFQPVPEPFRSSEPLIYASAAILIGGGAALLSRKAFNGAAATLAIWLMSWILFLHAFRIPWERMNIGYLLPGSEVLAVAAGAALLVHGEGMTRIWSLVWLRLFAAAQIVFGVCHFVFMDITASMIPALLPGKPTLAALTGVAHLAAAAAFAFGVRLRLAGGLLCAMYLGFLFLVCAPLLVTEPGKHLHWLMTIITGLCAVGGWTVRQRAEDLEWRGLPISWMNTKPPSAPARKIDT